MNRLDVLYGAAALVTAPWWAGKARSGWGERFARVLPEVPARRADRPRVMLHAVSVGEVNALRGLVPRLCREAEVVVTASTDTGMARARELFAETCVVARYPLDASWAVGRFLDRVCPDVVGLVELELWPQFVGECRARGVPVAVVNGRLSERSFRGYRRIGRWISPTFASLSLAAVQDEAYAERFCAMGVSRERIVVTGSMKFDSVRMADDEPGSAALAAAMGIDRGRPLIVAGSTGPGEEALLHRVCEGLWPDGSVQLLCAPRRPERFEEAAAALPGCVRRSTHPDGAGAPGGASRFLLDTIGELRRAYALADVAVVGRSFFDQHGSDPVEPIGLGKAAVIGPAVSDFAEIVASLEAAGGLARATRASLGLTLEGLLADPERRRGMVRRGRACVEALGGASARHAELLLWLASHGCIESPNAGEPAERTRSGR